MTVTIQGRALNPVTKAMEPWELSLASLVDGIEFKGRPVLTRRLAPAFEDLYGRGARSSAYSAKVELHYFWKFLDHFERLSDALVGTASPTTIDDLDWDQVEHIWRHWTDWLRQKPATLSRRARYNAAWRAYSLFRRAFDMAREANETKKGYLNIYLYFKSTREEAYGGDALSWEEAKACFAGLALVWRKVVSRVENGAKLAAGGSNPMVGSGNARVGDGIGWKYLCNRLWSIRNHLPFGVVARPPFQDSDMRWGMGMSLPPELVIPELGQETAGLKAHASCVFLRKEELAVAFAMVSMKTGMNPDAISRMTVDDWCHDDPFDPEGTAVLYGPKRDGRSNLRASSSKRKPMDAYWIIRQVIEIQQPIRDRLLEVAAERGDPKLAMMASLIWIGVGGPNGVFNLLPTGSSYYALHRDLDALFGRLGITRSDKRPMVYRVTQGRDIWGLFVYHRSGFNQILTARALGQSTVDALLHYLEKRVLIVEQRKALVDLQGRVFSQVRDGSYSPRSLRSGVAQQAATGLFCNDELHPSQDADPGNGGGQRCRAQGCWTCRNWFATAESLVALTRMVADLVEIERTVPLALWETSDYPIMLEVYRYIIGKFHASLVEEAEREAMAMPPIILTTMFSAFRAADPVVR